MKCIFPSSLKGACCPNCDQDPLPFDFTEIPKRECTVKAPNPDECPHLRRPTKDQIRVHGTGCSSERVMTTIWSCELHGDCIPLPRGRLTRKQGEPVPVGSPRFCKHCPDRPHHLESSCTLLPRKSGMDSQ